ncbi:MAG: PAS domain S-box protein [Verrucomicrobiota bacterium]
MKKMLQVALSVLAALSIGSYGDNTQCRKVRVGIFPVEPLNFMDQEGVACGLNPDLLREVSREQKTWEPEFVPVTWAEGLEKLQSEEVDLMVSVSYTPERAEVMEYTRSAVYEVWGQVFARPDANIASTLNLNGKRVGIVRGDINGENFIKLMQALGIKCLLEEYATHADVFSAVESNAVVAGAVPSHFGARFAGQYNLVDTSIRFSPSPIYFASKKGRMADVLKDIDFCMDQWKQEENSFYYNRLSYWFEGKWYWVKRIPTWVAVLLGGAVATTCLFVAVSWILKHQVKIQTVELVASEERYRVLVENQSDLVVELDLEGRFLYVNPNYCTLVGKSEEELLSRSFEPLVSEEGRLVVDDVITPLLKPPYASQIEQRIMAKDGWRWLSWKNSAVLNEDGKLEGIIGVGRDVTDQKQIEAERERLMAAIDQVAETVLITDTEGMIQYANPAFEEISGYTRKEVQGKNPSVLSSGEHNTAFYQKMWATLLCGEAWSGRLVNRKKDDSLYTEDATISPVRDSHGNVVNYVAIKMDITNMLVLEERYRQAQKMESIGRLAGGVAHDFNNILQVISGFCALLLAGLEPRSTQQKDALEIQEAVRHAGSLTRQLLAFSRKQSTEYKMLDLNTILSSAKKMLLQTLDDRFHLEFKLGDGLMPTYADETQILQVTMNLVVNARDAMSAGGHITISTRNVEIAGKDLSFIPNSRIGKFVCLSVLDAGKGISEDQLPSLFDPFYSTKQPGMGTGLGLSVVYGIVKDHQGWINVDSTLGHGSSFQVFLPTGERVRAEPGPRGQGGSASLPGKRILFVEGDPVIRDLTGEILQGAGYAVSSVENLQMAEEVFNQKRGGFELLFSDMTLPDGNGVELADSLLGRESDLQVLLFGGHSREHADVVRIKEKGFTYLQKPFNLNRLLSIVHQVTGDHKSMREA